MESIKIQYIEDLTERIADDYDLLLEDDRDSFSVSVVANYQETCALLNSLIRYGFEAKNIELSEPELDNYDDAFIITICNICDSDGEIWIQKAWNDYRQEYYMIESEVVYVWDDVNSGVLEGMLSNKSYLVHMEDSHIHCDGDCESCEYYSDPMPVNKANTDVEFETDEDDTIHGVTLTKSDDNGYRSYSYYSSDELSDGLIEKLMDVFS